MFNMDMVIKNIEEDLVPNCNKYDLLGNVRTDLISDDFRARDLISVDDFVIYISTTNVAGMFYETMIFNTDINPITIQYKDDLVDWDSEYNIFRTEGLDKLQAFKNHYIVVEFFKALDRKIRYTKKVNGVSIGDQK